MSERTRPYRAEDAAAVREVHLRAFDGREDEARLVEMLHAAGAAPVSLVAATEPGGRVVGHVLFSPVRIDGRGSGPPMMVGLAPLGVLPEHQGRGVGSRLIREGLDACREAGYDAAVVPGEADYYSRFGFERASGMGLKPPPAYRTSHSSNSIGVPAESPIQKLVVPAASTTLGFMTNSTPRRLSSILMPPSLTRWAISVPASGKPNRRSTSSKSSFSE